MSARPPNILFIVLDTLRRDRLSAYGHRRETSPRLDEFAARSVVYERAVAPAQWTIPSHASMFTGLYPSTHGLAQANGMLPASIPTLAELLRGAGYRTTAFCNNPLVGVLNNGLQRGFERFYNYASAAPFRPVEARRGRLQQQLLRLFRRHFARPLGNQFAHSDFLFRASLNPVFVPLWTRLINYKGHTAHSITDLIDFWGEHHRGGAERPLFAFLNLMGSHLPYNPPQDALDRIAPHLRREPQAYRFMRRFNAEAERWASPTDPPLADWEQAALQDFYDAEIAHQDTHLGRLLEALAASGQMENTLILICADHGEGHGDHRFFGHGFVVHQELVHVPLVIRHPDWNSSGRRSEAVVSTRRIFHTLLEATRINAPGMTTAETAAHSLLRAVDDGADPDRGLAMAEAFPPLTFLKVIEHRAPALIPQLSLRGVRRALYEGTDKLTVIDQKVDALYDVAADPAEGRDLAAERAGRAAELQRKLATLVSRAELLQPELAAAAPVDDSVVEHLRALGYIE
ncbi:MAG: sulfatase [Anaerolineae bacterium]|nr:sulfatase [Anaerolineae bacterium]